MNDGIAITAQYGFVVSFAIAAVVWLRLPRRSKWELLAIGVLGSVLCLALIKVGGALYYHPRPFVTDHIEPLFPHVADNGFPFDHTALTMLVALCVLYFSRRWGLVLVAVSLVAGMARVLAHVHSPLDIAGAVAMAAVAAVLARAIVTRLAQRVRRPHEPGRESPGRDQRGRLESHGRAGRRAGGGFAARRAAPGAAATGRPGARAPHASLCGG